MELTQSADEVERNLCLWHLLFCRGAGFSLEKARLVFETLRRHHAVSVAEQLPVDTSTERFREALLQASAKDEPVVRLSFEDVKAIVAYYVPTYFRHYQLYQHIFDPARQERVAATTAERKRIERPPPTQRQFANGDMQDVLALLLPPLASALSEADWLEAKRQAEQAQLDAENERRAEESRLRRDAELAAAAPPEPEPEPEEEPEPIEEMMARMVAGHFSSIKAHAEAVSWDPRLSHACALQGPAPLPDLLFAAADGKASDNCAAAKVGRPEREGLNHGHRTG
jgi:hypothetical protein